MILFIELMSKMGLFSLSILKNDESGLFSANWNFLVIFNYHNMAF